MATAETDTSGQPLYDLTGFRRDLLTLIDRLDNPHGLAVKEEMQAVYEDEINHSRLYPNLDKLVDKGLVEKAAKDRRTNEYSLTSRGRRELDAHRDWMGVRDE